ncbi:MAG: phosphotransferase [Bacteroidales bacterium]|nr:phosphotransferase [Bacteroidales bacterium]
MDNYLQKEFGFTPIEIKKLDGYENVNYLVKTNGNNYILKTYKYNIDLLDIVKSENKVLLFLNKFDAQKYPKPISFTDGSLIKVRNTNNGKQIIRMLTYIDGESFCKVESTKELFQSLGIFLAEIDIALQQFDSNIILVRQWEWDIQYLELNKKFIDDIPNTKDRNTVNHFFKQFEENVKPRLPELRKQVIHNDANEWNTLVKNGRVSGIIDFGDLANSLLINELAVAIAYACFDKENPLKWASIILKSYNNKLAIKENEIKVLYYLIAARLSVSVCNSAHSRKINPNNKYAFASEKSAWEMLYRWKEINPIFAENKFRIAVGLTVD